MHRLHHLHWTDGLWLGQDYFFGLGLEMSPVPHFYGVAGAAFLQTLNSCIE